MSKQMKIAKKNKIFINEEKVYDRLSELYEYVNNFPKGEITDAAKNEIKYLESLI